nr:MAG TPA: tail tape measure protein [Caudoviricetes sp.]
MILLDLFVKISVDTSEVDKNLWDTKEKALSFGDVLKANIAGQAIVAGVKAVAGAVKNIGEAAIQRYGEYEQLVGGVETLFKSSADTVMLYAANAYQTAGMSANEYMTTVTAFSASLLQSMGNDTDAAAEKANLAITDVSDNANKMGSSMESIQNAYSGFAKQNYTMLDNLKLGYGGTKEEMQRLLTDAEKLSGVKYDLSSYADIVDAIHVVQTEMGITGTTAAEAATTIEGSANAMKSAWSNLITGMSNENLDLGKLVQNVIDSVKSFADNLIPRLQIMLPRFIQGLTQLISNMIPYVAPALELLLPPLIEGLGGLVSGIVQALPAAVKAISAVIPMLVQQLAMLLPQIVSAGVSIIASLAEGLGDNLPALIPAAVDAIITVAEGLVDHVDEIIIAAGSLIAGLTQGLIEALPRLVVRLPEIIGAIVKGLLSGMSAIGEVGVQLVRGLWEGISSSATWLWNKLSGWCDDILGWVLHLFGINSPSKVFADEVGKFIPPGITLGVEQAMPRAMRDMGAQLSALSAIPTPGSTTTNLGGVNIVVYGAQGQDVSELADIVMARMQSAVERREAVFA